MKPYYADDRATVHYGDCFDVLRGLPNESVDAVVTDPPYGLSFMSREWDRFTAKQGGSAFQSWCEQWAAECLRALKPGGHLLAFGGTRTWHRLASSLEDAGFEIRDSLCWLYGSGFPKSMDVSKAIDKAAGGTKPATRDARCWQGWGTALKPAYEPIVLARKPLAGIVAANVLAHGTGALNIDGCRVKATDTCPAAGYSSYQFAGDPKFDTTGIDTNSLGRWPANVVLDAEAAAMLDEQSCTRPEYDDLGGASRFFYTAKADSSERPRYRKDGAGEGRVIEGTTKVCRICGSKTIKPPNPAPSCGHNDYERVPTAKRAEQVAHPTVKPLDLMRWLVRLITPPGGTVLDPFAGSGATVEACILEKLNCVAVEREADYLPLIMQRIHRQTNPVAHHKLIKGGDEPTLFDLLWGDAAEETVTSTRTDDGSCREASSEARLGAGHANTVPVESRRLV